MLLALLLSRPGRLHTELVRALPANAVGVGPARDVRRRWQPDPAVPGRRAECPFALSGDERCRADLAPVSCPQQARGGPGPGARVWAKAIVRRGSGRARGRTTVVSPIRSRHLQRTECGSDRPQQSHLPWEAGANVIRCHARETRQSGPTGSARCVWRRGYRGLDAVAIAVAIRRAC
jgi:hypothetical protein